MTAFSCYVEQITRFVGVVASDVDRNDATVRAAIGLIGDLASTYRVQMRQTLQSEEWLLRFIQQPLDADFETSESTANVINWTLGVPPHCLHPPTAVDCPAGRLTCPRPALPLPLQHY